MDKPKADRRISDTVLYFYEGAFTLWRQRMAGICEEARKKGWRIQPVNVDIMTRNAKSVRTVLSQCLKETRCFAASASGY